MPTHGSLSKAGKVRSISGSKKDKSKPRSNPRVENRRKYNSRIVLERNAAQDRQNRQKNKWSSGQKNRQKALPLFDLTLLLHPPEDFFPQGAKPHPLNPGPIQG